MAATDALNAEANQSSSSIPRVVILGGGIAGIVTATHLASRLRGNHSAEFLLIDRDLACVEADAPHLRRGAPRITARKASVLRHTQSATDTDTGPGDLCDVDRERKTFELGAITLPDGTSKLLGGEIA